MRRIQEVRDKFKIYDHCDLKLHAWSVVCCARFKRACIVQRFPRRKSIKGNCKIIWNRQPQPWLQLPRGWFRLNRNHKAPAISNVSLHNPKSFARIYVELTVKVSEQKETFSDWNFHEALLLVCCLEWFKEQCLVLERRLKWIVLFSLRYRQEKLATSFAPPMSGKNEPKFSFDAGAGLENLPAEIAAKVSSLSRVRQKSAVCSHLCSNSLGCLSR